jgi:threonine/homoserine/homoserine lactone efflux protein
MPRHCVLASPRVTRALERVAGAALIGFGLKLALTK